MMDGYVDPGFPLPEERHPTPGEVEAEQAEHTEEEWDNLLLEEATIDLIMERRDEGGQQA